MKPKERRGPVNSYGKAIWARHPAVKRLDEITEERGLGSRADALDALLQEIAATNQEPPKRGFLSRLFSL